MTDAGGEPAKFRLPMAPPMTPVSVIVIALCAINLVQGYFVNDALGKLAKTRDFIAQECARINELTPRSASYYADGVGIYHNFDVAWTAHGYPDIGANWEALATRDRNRVTEIELGKTVKACDSQATAAPVSAPPIPFYTMRAVPVPLATNAKSLGHPHEQELP